MLFKLSEKGATTADDIFLKAEDLIKVIDEEIEVIAAVSGDQNLLKDLSSIRNKIIQLRDRVGPMADFYKEIRDPKGLTGADQANEMAKISQGTRVIFGNLARSSAGDTRKLKKLVKNLGEVRKRAEQNLKDLQKDNKFWKKFAKLLLVLGGAAGSAASGLKDYLAEYIPGFDFYAKGTVKILDFIFVKPSKIVNPEYEKEIDTLMGDLFKKLMEDYLENQTIRNLAEMAGLIDLSTEEKVREIIDDPKRRKDLQNVLTQIYKVGFLSNLLDLDSKQDVLKRIGSVIGDATANNPGLRKDVCKLVKNARGTGAIDGRRMMSQLNRSVINTFVKNSYYINPGYTAQTAEKAKERAKQLPGVSKMFELEKVLNDLETEKKQNINMQMATFFFNNLQKTLDNENLIPQQMIDNYAQNPTAANLDDILNKLPFPKTNNSKLMIDAGCKDQFQGGTVEDKDDYATGVKALCNIRVSEDDYPFMNIHNHIAPGGPSEYRKAIINWRNQNLIVDEINDQVNKIQRKNSGDISKISKETQEKMDKQFKSAFEYCFRS